MSQYDDDSERLFNGDEDDEGATCNKCGATGLDWHHTGVRWRLMDENGRLHVCPPLDASADFEVVKP